MLPKKRNRFTFSTPKLSHLLVWLGVLVSGISYGARPNSAESNREQAATPDDSTRYGIKKTAPVSTNDLNKPAADLRDPDNIKTEAEYNEKDNTYKLGSKIGDNYLNTPFLMSAEEYNKWSLRKSMRAFYRKKNAEEYENRNKKAFDFTDMNFDLGPAEKIFGPGGVQIKTQGSAGLKIGANMKSIDNPSLPIRQRKTFGFDFDETINLSVQGKIGDKMEMNLDYNTESTFSFDSKSLKLQYQGKEDEIVKLLEGGNISMPSNNSLIQGASSLFGIRADLQFGKLKLQTVASQKESVTKSVTSQGGTQLTAFEIQGHNYEANRHFFLGHYFRDNYTRWMKGLPNIQSGITINRVEVWVTNKNGTTTNTRNIVAFTDLGESSHFNTNIWHATGNAQPTNTSNDLYNTINTEYADARNINSTTSVLAGINGFVGGIDYEKLESARKLNSTEYTINKSLGYISLKTTLQTDQVLAVAYEYTYMGQTYQVGEFSTDQTDNKNCLYVKTLKNAANTPSMQNWDLMMKNVYSLGATSVEQASFRLDIKYLSDTTGVYLNYLPEEKFKNQPLIRLLGLDRLDNKNNLNPNGYFDFVEGYTIDRTQGRIFFTSVEPFGSYLDEVLGDPIMAEKYKFQALYDSTRTQAQQNIEKDKFILTGQYKATSGNIISLGAMNVPRGSVVVTAGGVTLMENSDYTVNYATGEVTIINQSILDAGTPVNVSLESTAESFERKTMFGVNWEYDFTKNFLIGGTLMHLSEQSLTTKVAMGNEPLNNTIWGLNMSWKQKSQWLTDLLDKLPLLHLTEPSSINFTAEFAQLITGKNNQSQSNASYLDDFESTKQPIDISTPSEWVLSSTPALFSESQLTNDIRYGFNRALLSWYKIDPLFTRRSSSLTPGHIKGDIEQLSNHYVREVNRSELFPNRELTVGESTTLDVLNLAYYPSERGPYNLNPDLNNRGKLNNPQAHWGGMMRAIDNGCIDFETANIEYIEFWMMDPFIYSREKAGNFSGDFYINLGDISEDVLKDGNKFYESGMPLNGDTTQYKVGLWGYVPTQSTVTYAFNTSSGARSRQDIGLNGLTSAQEAQFPIYAQYLEQIRSKVDAAVYDSIAADPAGDDYHYYRGSDFDANKVPILQRYLRINNPEGNSVDTENSPEKYSTAYRTTPDAEDVNKDYTLNEYNNYYEYRIHLSPDSMQVGMGYIVDRRQAVVTLRNGQKPTVNWYLFRVPLREYQSRIGNITDFSSIRFMRMYLTHFEEPIVLRLGTLELVRGEWRSYKMALYGNASQNASGTLEVSAVSLEENNNKTPVNYVLPPGVSRDVDRNGSQLRENNEQALNITVKHLTPGDARAVYKNTSLDLRQYRHLQMFAHANALTGDASLKNDETSVFIRFGSDYKNNYYEYEVPLKVTPAKWYDTYSLADCQAVWPEDNMVDIDLSVFTDIKTKRNKQKSLGMASYNIVFSDYDENRPNNKISILGNPSIGEIRTIMIGIRNNSRAEKSVEVWVNELRLQDYTDEGGWAPRAKLDMQLSNLASLALSGHIETSGFGGLEQGINERRNNNLYEYGVTTNPQLGKFFPEKARVNAPLYYSYNRRKIAPKYNPLDTDVRLKDALDVFATQHERDSLEDITTTTNIDRNFSLSNLRVDISTKNHPMPYDPANFSFSYSHSHKYTSGETTVWESNDTWRFNTSYNYAPVYKPWEPFKGIKSKSNWWKILKDEKINFLPQSFSMISDINRTYYELQERDMQNLDNTSLPLNWSSDFLWNRSLALTWDLTNNIHASIQTATNAEIEEPYTPINKELYPDRYTAWKDSVWHSIKNFGTPLRFQQSFNASWKVPINKLPILDWTNLDANYTATYNWNRGATLANGRNPLGNNIDNSRNVKLNGTFNFENLYNKVPFLKETNRYFALKRGSTSKEKKTEEKKTEKKPFEKEIQLYPDSLFALNHGQKSRKLRVTAIRPDGKRYPLRYKVKNLNSIDILSKDTCKIKVTVKAIKPNEEGTWYKLARLTARTAMMVRKFNVSYTDNFSMALPGFMPNVGDFFGQNNSGSLAPGLDFAFGFTGEKYIEKARSRGWLSDSISSPATTNLSQNLQLSATIEPIEGLKIDLNASRTLNRARSILYMYEGSPTTQTGSFSMTTISISSAFEGTGNADNGYRSKTFERFTGYLESFRNRVEAQYQGAPYPNNSKLAGTTFNPENGTIDPYSSDVMIPAFLAAYCGGNEGSSLSIFPSITKLLPNWNVSYSGLMRIGWFRRHFKSFTLEHAYKSLYSVGSYNTYSSYMSYMGDLGFVNNTTTGNPVPSSMFDVSTVSINEAFSPFCGVSATFLNNLTASIKYNRTRVLTLSMTSQQLTEALSNDMVIGLGYKINNLKLFNPPKKRKITNKKKDENGENAADANTETGMSTPLNLRVDVSLRDQSAVNRNVVTGLSQATSGNKAFKLSFMADYTVSKLLTLSAYFERQTTTPLLTSSAYPTTTQDFGVSMKFQLTR